MRLDEYLRLNNLSLRAFARETGLGVATISRLRKGDGMGSRRTLNAIVQATGGSVTITDLVEVAVQFGPGEVHSQGINVQNPDDLNDIKRKR